MKVLGLVASCRRLGNSEIIVKEVMNALPGGWDKQMIRLSDLRIDLCKACYACLAASKRCVIDDDLNFFLDQVKAADKVIIAAPVYYLGQHTSLKLINDRMISIQNNSAEYFTGKQCVIVVPHTVPNWEGYAREATMHFARFLGLEVAGSFIVNSTLPGDAINGVTLASIQKLTQSLVDNVAVDFSDPDQVYCPDCDSSLLQIFKQGKWRCVMCGATGTWSVQSGGFALSWEQGEHRRYTRAGMEEHGLILNEVKNEYIRRREQVVAAQSRYRAIDFWIKPEAQCSRSSNEEKNK